MRAIVVGLVAFGMVFAGAAEGAIPRVHNPALRSVVANAFQSVKYDVNGMDSCKGCTESAQAVYEDTAAGEKSLNALPDYSGATFAAYLNAFKALQFYSRFALAYADSYISAQNGGSNAGDFHLALTYLKQARGFATRADEALSIRTLP